MPTDLVLRPAVAADAPAVAQVHLESRHAAAMPPGRHDDEQVRAWLADRLACDEVWVAGSGAEVVGYARMSSGAWLDDLYVSPTRARTGIGTALLDVVKALRPGGFCLWVFEVNQPARAFYRSRGLIELERTDGSGNEEQAPDVKLAWPGADPVAFFRGLIDEVDEQLGDLLARRAALTRAVQAHKPATGRDLEREREIAAALARRAPALGPDRLARIVHVIITESLAAAAEL